MNHSDLREQMVSLAYSMFMRGYSSGGAGNLSTRLPGGGYLVTPTNSSFGSLDASTLSELDENGNWISGDKPSKETVMHLAFYRQRPDIGGIVHLHSPSLTALSCVPGLDPSDCLPPLTPYFIMRVGKLPLVHYFRPGHEGLADEVAKLAPAHNAMLLANHGPIIGGANLREATFNAEELEDTARLWFTLQPHGMVTLTKEQVHELQLTFGKKND
ncbi:3-oxo-tetronate 4-phosphate decarboxylase [Klebsiella oxytoca]|uniref:3-oxo-tetronate 4-phosphate decarboxylase n=1 Tax=Klebsiella oxytoca TaxID=571 RepID=UPI001B99C566|nr:aldolase [Klebsiella oxytoca]EKU2383534.1 aldolase [Klebsiella oxytoca]MBX4773400.1 aldolase [Klebsiella oxytoca]HBC7471417.1 aldolase [Klebsiella oxytoca]HBM7350216.1 aldolase [Klebsiella oxytoca]HCB2156333.1 aldolase [Klebsiella oxytoca]